MNSLTILIGGPTASGKTSLAFEIAKKIPSIIINADSMQTYDNLKLLTNQPTEDQKKEFDCKLFGFIKYPNSSNVALWGKKVKQVLFNNPKKVPIFVGGSGMYLNSVINDISKIPDINPKVRRKVRNIQKKYGNKFLYEKLIKKSKEYHGRLQIKDTQRIIRAMEVHISTGKPIFNWFRNRENNKSKNILYVALKIERSELYTRINERCERMIELGVINEIEEFIQKNIIEDGHPLLKAIGFNIFQKYLISKINFNSSIDNFKKETRRYAKRQVTWFKNKSSSAKQLDYLKAKNYILENLNKN